MSEGMSISTGPGRPEAAIWNASRNVEVSSSVDCSRKECFTTGMVMPTMSDSWKLSVPMTPRGTWPVMTTSGTLSM